MVGFKAEQQMSAQGASIVAICDLSLALLHMRIAVYEEQAAHEPPQPTMQSAKAAGCSPVNRRRAALSTMPRSRASQAAWAELARSGRGFPEPPKPRTPRSQAHGAHVAEIQQRALFSDESPQRTARAIRHSFARTSANRSWHSPVEDFLTIGLVGRV